MGILFTVNAVDGAGRSYSKEFEFATTDYATALAAAPAVLERYANVTTGGIKSARFTIPYSVTPTSPDPAANRDEGFTFSAFLDTALGKRGSLKIKAIDKSHLAENDVVDLSDAKIAAFLALWTGGTLYLSDGEAVDEFIRGTLDA